MQKRHRVFLFPIADVHKLIGLGKCSEMDALLGSLIHAVYNDPSVQGSDAGPVVYFRKSDWKSLCSVIRNLPDVGNSRNLLYPVCLKNLKIPTSITLDFLFRETW